jgi:hypothetical protein
MRAVGVSITSDADEITISNVWLVAMTHGTELPAAATNNDVGSTPTSSIDNLEPSGHRRYGPSRRVLVVCEALALVHAQVEPGQLLVRQPHSERFHVLAKMGAG